MGVEKFLKTKQWHCMGKWKEPVLIVNLVISAVVDQTLPSVFGQTPSAYIGINLRQYVVSDDYARNGAAVRALFQSDPRRTSHRMQSVIAQSIRRTLQFSAKRLTPGILEQYFRHVSHRARHWYEIMCADRALTQLYPKTLPKKFKLSEREYTPESLLAEVALPKKLFPMIRERYDLLRIALRIRKGQSVAGALVQHVKQYGWMNSLGLWEPPFTVEHYKKEAEKLAKGDPKKELEQLQQERRQRYQHANRVLYILKQCYPQAWHYVDIIRELTDLKEENWDSLAMTHTRLRLLFSELARRHHLSYDQLMQLTPPEMTALVQRGTVPIDVDELNVRIRGFAIVSTSRSPYIVVGGKKAFVLERLVERKPTMRKTLQGMVVWQGVVRGKARLILSVDQVSKIKKGEILICPMSDPDYMPAIKKAAAIVADHGGLLCHAAIVSRELGIPCVVGTEYATKVLKDGDLVEVDAERGVVRKLKI